MTNKTLKTIAFFLCITSLSFAGNLKNTVKEKIIETNGIKTYCKILGEGEPLVIVHGGPGMAHNYLLPKFKRLAENYQVIFYDQRANGKSTGEENPEQITIENLVEDLEALRKAFGLEKMNLIGQSWGGLLAMNYAIKYPENLKSLIILESGPANSEYMQEIGETVMERLSEEDKAKLTEITISEEFKNHDSKTHIDFYMLRFKAYFYDMSFYKELDLSYFNEEMIRKNSISEPMFIKYFDEFDIYGELGKIHCPTLFIHGKYDVIPYQAIERMHDNINGSKLILFENCGHFAHIEKTKEYFSAIEKFLSDNKNMHQTQNKTGKAPVDIVQQQVEAYNAHDIEAFLATYSPDIEIFLHPNTLRFAGLEQMKTNYKQLFENSPERHAEIVNRIVLGSFVIDQEKVTGSQDGKIINAVAIYEVQDGLIHKVWFIPEK